MEETIVYWDRDPETHDATEYAGVHVAFSSTTEFEHGDHGARVHRLFVKWSLPWGCSNCPAGVPMKLQGTVRDSRREENVFINGD